MSWIDEAFESYEEIQQPITAVEISDPLDLSKRLSYSSVTLLHTCPRKFELYKMGVGHSVAQDDSTSLTFQYGHTVGTGMQDLISGKSIDEIVWSSFLAWSLDLLVENPKQNKDFWEALYSLTVLEGMLKGGFLQDWHVMEIPYNDASIPGVHPAAELSFRITFPNGYTYIGFVDLVLEHDFTGEVMVLEGKTTSAKYVKPEQYKNSAQAIGYSIVLDHIHKDLSSYKVLYLPYLTGARRYDPMEFTKAFSQRARWITELILDIETIELYKAHDLFPMHGENCLSFGRPCNYYGTCTMSNSLLQKVQSTKVEPERYDYEINIEDLIATQLQGIEYHEHEEDISSPFKPSIISDGDLLL